MGIIVYSLQWVLQDLDHQPYFPRKGESTEHFDEHGEPAPGLDLGLGLRV